jgi:hypothetical protein
LKEFVEQKQIEISMACPSGRDGWIVGNISATSVDDSRDRTDHDPEAQDRGTDRMLSFYNGYC